MEFIKKKAFCPVCNAFLGFLERSYPNAFVCKECDFIFRWNKQGKILKPIKVEKHRKEGCACGRCGR